MRAVCRTVAFALLGLLLCLPVLAADEKEKKADAKKDADKADVKKDAKKEDKKDDKPPVKMPPVPKTGKHKNLETSPEAATDKMIKAGTVRGKVMGIQEDKKTLRLDLTIPYLQINQGALQNYRNAYIQLMQSRNPQQMIQHQQQMAQAQAQIYQVATKTVPVEWQASDEVKVRWLNPPPQFDDKGRIKRYTAKELKELKGNDKLPGYPAEFSDVKQDQIVEVTLVRKKDAPRPVGGRRGRDADPELAPDNQPQMSMIIIVAEPRN